MSTRCEPEIRALDTRLLAGRDPRKRPDQVEEMALVAQARRELLLRAHRHRLRKEDLEDCYSQATLELLAQARGGGAGSPAARTWRTCSSSASSRASTTAAARCAGAARAGRAGERAAVGRRRGGDVEVADVRAEVEQARDAADGPAQPAAGRARADPRSAAGSHQQVDSGMDCAEFCRRFGWSKEKYRKVAQRARARLRELLASEEGRGQGARAGESRPAGPASRGSSGGERRRNFCAPRCPVRGRRSEREIGTHL